MEPPSLVRTPLHPAMQLALYELAGAIGDRPLASIAAVRVDQRGPGTAVAHPVHQLAERGSGHRTERVASMAKVMKVQRGQARLGQRGAPPGAGSCHPAWGRCSGW
jgi:hypothetical protein